MRKSISEWMWQQRKCGQYATIDLVDMSIREDGDDIVHYTTAALDLIKHLSVRRYGRIMREVRYIVSSHIVTAANYRQKYRCIRVDFQCYHVHRDDSAYAWYIAAYASMLIHEATHGYLFSKRIPYNEATWKRCEIICNREEKRFVSLVKIDGFDTSKMVGEIDEDRYKSIQRRSFCSRIRFSTSILAEYWANNIRTKH